MGTEETDEIKETIKLANDDLMNWGRSMNDAFLEHNLGIAPPPTSEGYIAPINIHDEPEPAKIPVDEAAAKLAEHVVVSIGCERGGFDSFRVLVHWYTRLVFHECTTDERYYRLAKKMHCSVPGAKRMLKTAQLRFWDLRQVMGELDRHYRVLKNQIKQGKIVGGS